MRTEILESNGAFTVLMWSYVERRVVANKNRNTRSALMRYESWVPF